jgi:hypothetical protein
MKKILLSFCCLLAHCTLLYAQTSVYTSTGYSNDGFIDNGNMINEAPGSFPNNGEFTVAEGGGEITISVAKGSGYSGMPVKFKNGDATDQTINMSGAAGRKLIIKMRVNPVPVNGVQFRLVDNNFIWSEDAPSVSPSNTSDSVYTIIYPSTGAEIYTCGSAPSCILDSTHIQAFWIFVDPGASYTGTVVVDHYTIGDVTVTPPPTPTSTSQAQKANIHSKVYPNPATESATLELNLDVVSDVKIALTDLVGKELMVITEGKMSEISKSIDVSVLPKGMYAINYFVNGVSAKSQMLIVQ